MPNYSPTILNPKSWEQIQLKLNATLLSKVQIQLKNQMQIQIQCNITRQSSLQLKLQSTATTPGAKYCKEQVLA